MSGDPPTHLRPRPRPRDRVGVALVVLPPARVEVLDELLAALPLATLQVPLTERAEEQLSLIEPGGVRRCDERSYARIVPAQPRRRLVSDVRGTTVPDQMHAARATVLAEQVGQDVAKVLAVVPSEAEAAHLARGDDEHGQKVHRPVPDGLELLALDLAATHRLRSAAAFEHLDVRLLVDTEHDLALRGQNQSVFVAPEDLRGALDERCVELRGLPVARAMGLQVSCSQKERDGRVRDL